MHTSLKAVTAGLALALASMAPTAWADPNEDVAASASRWAQALGEDDPEKVLHFMPMMPCCGGRWRPRCVPIGRGSARIS
jgi:uncharacterized protein YfaP (DUF2135 family)